MDLDRRGFFRRSRVSLIGAGVKSIRMAEDREQFKRAMERIGLDMPRSGLVRSVPESRRLARRIGFPIVLRPSFTLAGTGAGIARTPADLDRLAEIALRTSPSREVLLEESVIGWKEFELEVIRDSADNVIVVCTIENVDPMGVHTGDSVTVAPSQTLSDAQFQNLRESAKKIIREIGVDTGGCNIQFAIHPRSGRVMVIEMNPRVSRSSALASKATGYPIAKVAARLAIGYTLDEIRNDVTKTTPAAFEPSMDYVVTKLPRFAFEKFVHADDTLDTQMKSVGETMAIGRNFRESLQKAVRGLEIGRFGLGADGRGMEGRVLAAIGSGRMSTAYRRMARLLTYKITTPNCDRLFAVKYGLMMGISPSRISTLSGIDPWFVDQIRQMVLWENGIRRRRSFGRADLSAAKAGGYTDEQIAFLTGRRCAGIRGDRIRKKIVPAFELVDTCAAEFASATPYFYSTYASSVPQPAIRSPGRKPPVMILGGGPNRIGQGIEFDYCCVQAAMTVKRMGRPVIMVNCNPETVSTDPEISDRLYFEPLTAEDVLEIVSRERPGGVIVQLGGQTPLNLCGDLNRAGVRILGTSPEHIDRAEDRRKFDLVLKKLRLRRPENVSASTAAAARAFAGRAGYPLLVRPSYVLGGRAMQVVFDAVGLDRAIEDAFRASAGSAPPAPQVSASPAGRPILIDRYLRDAVEVDVDAISDGRDTAVVGIAEHVEEAGVHSGDSACTFPPRTLSAHEIDEIVHATRLLAAELRIRGLLNVQFAIQKGRLYVLEANPRASRTVPFISKASGVPLVPIATFVMLGGRLRDRIDPGRLYFPGHYSVKEVVMPFLRFQNTDIALGPEMRSTGEVMGISAHPDAAFAKSQAAAGFPLPSSGQVLVSVQDPDKPRFLALARSLRRIGFSILATPGTARFLKLGGCPARVLPEEDRPRGVIDLIRRKKIQMILNTFQSTAGHSDFREIRRAALSFGVPIFTTLAAARYAVRAISSIRSRRPLDLMCLQDIHRSAPDGLRGPHLTGISLRPGSRRE